MTSGMGQDLALDLELALEGRRKRVPAEVKSLVALAHDLATLPDPEIDARFAARLEQRLLSDGLEAATPARHLQAVPAPKPQAPAEPVRRAPVVPLPRRRFVFKRGLVAAVAAAMLLAFPLAASANSLPGGLFHSFKVNVLERIELALAGGPVDDGFKHLDFAERRIGEIAQLLVLGNEGDVQGALDMMQGEQVTGVEAIMAATSDPAVLSRAARILEAQADALANIARNLSIDMRPAALDAASAAKALAERLVGATGDSVADRSVTTVAGATSRARADGPTPNVAGSADVVADQVTSKVPEVPEPEAPNPPTAGTSSHNQQGSLQDAYGP